jgi:hypothetical protein
MRYWVTAIFAMVMIAVAGCSSPKKSPRGFSLPDGDAAAGREAFIELRCHNCHQVFEDEMERPIAKPSVPVRLGGPVPTGKTDGELVTSIINPSHKIKMKGMSGVQSGDRSRMGDFTQVMTVRQMIDLVEYLHTRYKTPTPTGS